MYMGQRGRIQELILISIWQFLEAGGRGEKAVRVMNVETMQCYTLYARGLAMKVFLMSVLVM